MKRSEFAHAVEHLFGANGAVLLRDLVIPALGNQTPTQALEAGESPRVVWDALCTEMDIPASQRVATRLPQPKL
ncbi:MAG: DUF3046 domain-containing protein [Agromyces sp.]